MNLNANLRETGWVRLERIEVRDSAGSTDSRPVIEGYAAVFGQLSVVLRDWFNEFRERIEPGAFAASIRNDDIRALWNHNPDHLMGRVKNGTLNLYEDNHGLGFRMTPPDTQLARDFTSTIRDGYVDAMSIGFSVLDEDWDEDAQGQVIRTLNKIKLYEISPVAFPAYTGTEAQVRATLAGQGGERPQVPSEFRDLRRSVDHVSDIRRAQALLSVRQRRFRLWNYRSKQP
jgi:hypothetical protein